MWFRLDILMDSSMIKPRWENLPCLKAMFETIIRYILVAIGILLAYEIIRALILTKIRDKLYRSVKEYIEEYHVRIDRFKLIHKLVVKHELLNNGEIHAAILDHAREKDISIREVQDLVEEYIDEIVPVFNLLSYYKIGYVIANSLLNMIYEVVIDHENADKLKKIPHDSVVVFVMNHRSNIDYILVAYMLAQQISLSYAVGEWARVWPLEYIFKSFGAYFIRRKFREKLYHLVLEKYVQLISLQGVTQGIFLEGGLTRDGNYRQAKIGILDYIIGTRKNPSLQKELVFVPAAINYDWVLEDKNLVQEWQKGKEKSGFRDHVSSLTRILFKGPLILILNLFRYLTGRLKHHGYASVSFGDPVFLSEYLKKEKTNPLHLDRKTRLSRIQDFANDLMGHISSVMPVTPVSLVSAALLSFGDSSFTLDKLTRRIRYMRIHLKKKDCRMVLGREFEPSLKSVRNLNEEKKSRKKELVRFEEKFLEQDEAKQTVRMGLDLLKRRKAVTIKKGMVTINPKMRNIIEFYSNSIQHLLQGLELR